MSLNVPGGDKVDSRGQRPRIRPPKNLFDPEGVEGRRKQRFDPFQGRVELVAEFRGRCPRLLTLSPPGTVNLSLNIVGVARLLLSAFSVRAEVRCCWRDLCSVAEGYAARHRVQRLSRLRDRLPSFDRSLQH